jgi:hypothetical protein
VSPAPYRRCCWAARACSSIPPVATSVREVEKGCLGANRLGGTCMHRSGTGASHLSPVAPPAAFKRSTSTGMEDSDTWHFREPDRLAARPSWVSCKITITKMIMTRTPILSPMIPRFTSPPPFDSDGCFCCEASPTLCMAAILAPSTLNHPKGGCITPLKRFKGVSERSPRLPPDQRRNRTLARRALTGPSAMRDPSPESIGRDDIGKAAHDRQPSWPLEVVEPLLQVTSMVEIVTKSPVRSG